MIIFIYAGAHVHHSKELAKSVKEFLVQHKVTVVVEDKEAKEIGAAPLSSIDPKEIDFILSLGGDGTILGLIHHYSHLNTPILGINLGHLGFMADVPLDDVYPSLQDLLNGNYNVEERLILQGESSDGEKYFAVNDFVIHRSKNPNLIEIGIHVDGLYLNTFEADGMIIATPNGSTAYSLAAGGPILSPTLEAVVITPICPHTISNRPIVLTSGQKIQLQYLSSYKSVEVSADGLSHHTLQTGAVFNISCSPKKFRLVNLFRRDYFSTLRTKLSWSGKLR
ncbi:MAG: NAD(+)/NADH kinase [Rhabdochlamydiaceae bacterium]|jgi:NAD+ kinase